MFTKEVRSIPIPYQMWTSYMFLLRDINYGSTDWLQSHYHSWPCTAALLIYLNIRNVGPPFQNRSVLHEVSIRDRCGTPVEIIRQDQRFNYVGCLCLCYVRYAVIIETWPMDEGRNIRIKKDIGYSRSHSCWEPSWCIGPNRGASYAIYKIKAYVITMRQFPLA